MSHHNTALDNRGLLMRRQGGHRGQGRLESGLYPEAVQEELPAKLTGNVQGPPKQLNSRRELISSISSGIAVRALCMWGIDDRS